jgi:hypothetical protein
MRISPARPVIMAEMRGRPYAFVALILAGWTGGRLLWPIGEADTPTIQPALPLITPKPLVQVPDVPPPQARVIVATRSALASDGVKRRLYHKQHGLPPALVSWQDGGRPSGLPAPLRVAGDGKPLSPGRDTPPTIALAPVGKAGPPERLRPKRWDVYAYSYWRSGRDMAAGAAPAAQYGGSQSGLVASYDAFGSANRGVALLARAAMTPDGEERELATGLRWQPDQRWPLRLSGEYRMRANVPDLWAAYLSGGVSDMAIGAGWKLDAFGQAGYVMGGGANGSFFDAQARATHVIPLQQAAVGGGVWAGGQSGGHRVDIGPTIVLPLKTGDMVVLIQLDYRLRVAGDAEPRDGLALTLSTGL